METDDIRNEARTLLTSHIENKKMRKTPERFAILDVVLEMKGHHSVDEIQTMLPSDFPVSKPTIYSTMQILDELGIVQSHQFSTITQYERAIGIRAHHHYVCKACGSITDLVDPQIDYILGIAKTPRFSKEFSTATIFGLCSKCKAVINKKKKKEEKERLKNMSREEKRFAQIDNDLAKIAEDLAKVGIGGKKK